MRTAAEARRAVEQLIGLLLGKRDELFNVPDVEAWMNDENVGNRADEHNWRHVPFDIGTLTWHQCRVDRNRDRAKQKRVAILGAAGDVVGRHRAAGTRAIFHNYRLLKQFCELVADDASGNVAARARSKSEDQVDRARRIAIVGRRACLRAKYKSNDESRKGFQSNHGHTKRRPPSGFFCSLLDAAHRCLRYQTFTTTLDGFLAAFRPPPFDRSAGVNIIALVPVSQ